MKHMHEMVGAIGSIGSSISAEAIEKQKQLDAEKESAKLLRQQWCERLDTQTFLNDIQTRRAALVKRITHIGYPDNNSNDAQALPRLAHELQILDSVLNLAKTGEYKCQKTS